MGPLEPSEPSLAAGRTSGALRLVLLATLKPFH